MNSFGYKSRLQFFGFVLSKVNHKKSSDYISSIAIKWFFTFGHVYKNQAQNNRFIYFVIYNFDWDLLQTK